MESTFRAKLAIVALFYKKAISLYEMLDMMQEIEDAHILNKKG